VVGGTREEEWRDFFPLAPQENSLDHEAEIITAVLVIAAIEAETDQGSDLFPFLNIVFSAPPPYLPVEQAFWGDQSLESCR
jgi:hypothetical protein